jgi:ferritin
MARARVATRKDFQGSLEQVASFFRAHLVEKIEHGTAASLYARTGNQVTSPLHANLAEPQRPQLT